jgi:phage terminase small subunit
MALTPRQERFCQEYVILLNGTKAATNAGYSKSSANEQASRLLANDSIKARVAELQEEIKLRNELKADDIVQELRALGFWNIKDFTLKKNEIRDLSKMKPAATKPVVGIKTKTTVTTVGRGEAKATITETTTELKLADKRAALVDLGRHIGLFEKDNEQVKPSINLKVGYGKAGT